MLEVGMRLWIAALLTVTVALPAFSQHGGHAGGFSGSHGGVSHMGGGFGGGFRSAPGWNSAPRNFNAAPRYQWNSAPRTPYGGWHRPVYGGGHRPVYPNSRY